MLTRRLPFDEIRGNDLRVLWAIHSGKRPPPILGCPEVLESLMNRCWNKDAGVRPTMGKIFVFDRELRSRGLRNRKGGDGDGDGDGSTVR